MHTRIKCVDGPHTGLEIYNVQPVEDDTIYIVNQETDELEAYKISGYVAEHVFTTEAISTRRRMNMKLGTANPQIGKRRKQ